MTAIPRTSLDGGSKLNAALLIAASLKAKNVLRKIDLVAAVIES